MKTALLAVVLLTRASLAPALADGTPRIQFDQTLLDFGRTSQVATVSGVFKFKNVGDGVLKLEPPKPSCGCTLAELSLHTLQPTETGELPFTLHLGQAKAQFEKHIAVKSNDPRTPEVVLTIKVDYTPLYDVNPMTLAPKLAFGTNATEEFTTLTRTDGQPLRLVRLDASKPWISATVESGTEADAATARIRVAIQREEPPRRFNEYVHVYVAEPTNSPVASIYVYGQILGEVALSPEALYWSLPSGTNLPIARSAGLLERRVTIRSTQGKAFEVKNPQSTLKDVHFELVPKEAGQAYELVARLAEIPAATVSGQVSFETSVATQSRIEMPVIVHVFKP